jgi:hypothetical protein
LKRSKIDLSLFSKRVEEKEDGSVEEIFVGKFVDDFFQVGLFVLSI